MSVRSSENEIAVFNNDDTGADGGGLVYSGGYGGGWCMLIV